MLEKEASHIAQKKLSVGGNTLPTHSAATVKLRLVLKRLT